MPYKRESWTLVRYAGPASKALIGSKPIGDELGPVVRYENRICQVLVDSPAGIEGSL
jgi:hypothetical protein